MMELRPYQEECIEAIEAQPPGSYLVQMATGLGKCLGKGTPVLMFDGSVKPVEGITSGEVVMGPDSGPRVVSGVARGRSELFRITPVKGDPYVVNSEHILSLKITGMGRKRLTGPNGVMYKSGDVCNVSVLEYLSASKTFKHCAKGWRCGVDFPEQDVSIPPYILGIWLGDGASRTTEITTMDHEVVKELYKYASKMGLRLNVVSSENTGRTITYSITSPGRHGAGSNEFRNHLKEYGLIGNKHIPQCYLVNSRRTRMDLLAGMLDADGYIIDGNTFEIVSASKELSKDILFLARSLGLAAYSSDKLVNGKTYYRINISGETDEIPNRVGRRKASKRLQKKNALVTGISVESIGMGEYFGFELSGADRLFLLGDFTVTHNTITAANIPRHGRMLWLSHREELVEQPRKYFNCSFGVERAASHSHGEDVVSASVQSLVRRLSRFNPDDFDLLVVDEAHHSASPTYRKILSYFTPRKTIGITATPIRGDHIRLDDIFSKIIFSRDLRWGIENGYLCDIYCLRVNIGYDLSAVRTRMGDYAPGELDEAMEGTADAIAEAFQKYAKGPTLIFAVSVRQANEIASKIPGAVVVTGETKDRADIIGRFTAGEIPCIVNVMVFTEGTDIPRVETVIIARPTQSEALYSQMAGRGLRPFVGKDRLTLIDCVGVTGRASLCTAPTLLGIDASGVPMRKSAELQGPLFDLPVRIAAASDCPESWIRNVQVVDLWAKEQKYTLHDVNWFKMPDGSLVCSLANHQKIAIPCPDVLGMVALKSGERIPMQEALDRAYKKLRNEFPDQKRLWDRNAVKRWGRAPATESQLKVIQRRCKGFDTSELTKGQASMILNRLLNGGKAV